MNWLKNHPFQLVLLIVTLVLTALLGALGFTYAQKVSKAKAEFVTAKNKVQDMKGSDGFPNEENLSKLEELTTKYKGQVEAVKSSLQPYSSTFEATTPRAFATKLEEASKMLSQKLEANGTNVPEAWYLGLEKYRNTPADQEAIGKLNYQLDSLVWLHEKLAENGVSQIINIKRQELPVEGGLVEPKKKKSKKKLNVAESMPVQLTFKIKESGLRKVLNEIASSTQYFFSVKAIRLKTDPVSTDDKFEEGMLLKQVLGQEEITALLELELTTFDQEVELPTIK